MSIIMMSCHRMGCRSLTFWANYGLGEPIRDKRTKNSSLHKDHPTIGPSGGSGLIRTTYTELSKPEIQATRPAAKSWRGAKVEPVKCGQNGTHFKHFHG
ncbi:hypothetical protein [Candidatus Rhodobacter oscarellae]|uniref:hypothetical protein n=1 Tax=Candidatus Rhodobacter oscarellae TaxID=1675527 RepID=UPI00128ECCB3|nr:hypothetical protein [Candidatus Rhodobacter lobularis]